MHSSSLLVGIWPLRAFGLLLCLLTYVSHATAIPQAVLARIQAEEGPSALRYEGALPPRYRLRGSLSVLAPNGRSAFLGYGANVVQPRFAPSGPDQASYSLLNEQEHSTAARLQLENNRLMQENDHLLSEASKLRHREASMRRAEALEAKREERLKARIASLSSSLAHIREGRNKVSEPHRSIVSWALSALQAAETPASALDPEQHHQEQSGPEHASNSKGVAEGAVRQQQQQQQQQHAPSKRQQQQQ
mmetsp:Transcript_19073/g.41096  ORF Transcript_19073/g.41096 Transcript_19073/m.41096 type:complete len:248 (+) Transcript_19073:269-1012(+)